MNRTYLYICVCVYVECTHGMGNITTDIRHAHSAFAIYAGGPATVTRGTYIRYVRRHAWLYYLMTAIESLLTAV